MSFTPVSVLYATDGTGARRHPRGAASREALPNSTDIDGFGPAARRQPLGSSHARQQRRNGNTSSCVPPERAYGKWPAAARSEQRTKVLAHANRPSQESAPEKTGCVADAHGPAIPAAAIMSNIRGPHSSSNWAVRCVLRAVAIMAASLPSAPSWNCWVYPEPLRKRLGQKCRQKGDEPNHGESERAQEGVPGGLPVNEPCYVDQCPSEQQPDEKPPCKR